MIYIHPPVTASSSHQIGSVFPRMAKDRILVVAATGYLGNLIAKASTELGYPTFALIRPSSGDDAAKAKLLASLKEAGVTFLQGSLEDHETLIQALQQVDVVISAVGVAHLKEQRKLIEAIKSVGHIKRYLPSEFGHDWRRVHALPSFSAMVQDKLEIQNAVKAAGIPFTFVSSNGFANAFVANLCQYEHQSPPKDKALIYGHAKAYFVEDSEVATLTVKAAVDPRTENKVLFIRPAHNFFTHRELVELWEKKSGHHLEKIQLEEEDVVTKGAETPFPFNVFIGILYSMLVKGDQDFDIPADGVEATELYPELHCTTMDKFLDRFL